MNRSIQARLIIYSQNLNFLKNLKILFLSKYALEKADLYFSGVNLRVMVERFLITYDKDILRD